MKPLATTATRSGNARDWLWIALPLIVLLCLLFSRSFVPGQALFANDGPVGISKCRVYEMPSGFLSLWYDNYWLGGNSGSYAPNFYGTMRFLFGPIGYVNFSVPASLLILGLCAALFFRTLGFGIAVCSLAALAAALNGNFFSNSCWGLPSRATGLGMSFLALAALHSSLKSRPVMKTILAGLAIGMSISESGDNGAIFSLFIAAFAAFLHWIQPEPLGKRFAKGFAQVTVMAICAGLLAVQTINIFVNTAVKGIAGIEDKSVNPTEQWDKATQWSLPKKETLRVIIPGLFGYRLDSEKGGNYWGEVGRQPGWEQHHQGFPRHSGAGEYAGVLVVLVGIWAVANSFRRKDSTFSPTEKKLIWFWGGAFLVAMLFSWGRHAPFYRLVYSLPYFSTIRNPMKFMHPGHLCLLVLFGYGLQGIWKRYLSGVVPKAQDFEKKWLLGSLAAVGLSVLALIVYGSSGGKLESYLMNQGFGEPALARQIAGFSVNEVMLFLLFLAGSITLLILIQRGWFAGPKQKWASVCLGLLLVADMARADMPWIKYFDYREKYANNEILKILADKPWEHRVGLAMSMCVTPDQFRDIQQVYRFTQAWGGLQQIYGAEWMQHQFPYYNIEALEIAQEPRMPSEKKAYLEALTGKLARLYELTNTRFVCGLSGNFADALNQVFDPQQRRFRLHTPFDYVRVGQEGIGAQPNPNGQFALLEFTGALPRAKLYSQWEVNTNAPGTLARLTDAAFDPQRTVIIASDPGIPATTNATSAPGTAEIISYAPKETHIRTESSTPTVLLVNDKFDSGWKAWVDGKPQDILRCNLLVRGLALSAGTHTVVFRYEPPTFFWWTFSVVSVGLVLCGYLAATRGSDKLTLAAAPSVAPEPSKQVAQKSKA